MTFETHRLIDIFHNVDQSNGHATFRKMPHKRFICNKFADGLIVAK